jgi:hypothetical protein
MIEDLSFSQNLITKIKTDEILSLDIINFVTVTDLTYYISWIDYNVQYLCDLVDPHTHLNWKLIVLSNLISDKY